MGNSIRKQLSFLDRYLTLWIVLAIWRHLKLGRYTPLNHLQA